jgi:hypothetical protein
VATHVKRWLECDFPGCGRTFDGQQYAVARRVRPTVKSQRDAAADVGWTVTDMGEDLCPPHAEVHAGRPPQPELFAVPDSDQTM